MLFRVNGNAVYEDTGDPRYDKQILLATPSGMIIEGVGLGIHTDAIVKSVPESLINEAKAYWKGDLI